MGYVPITPLIFIKMELSLLNEFKICTKCKRDLPATTFYFHRSKLFKDGLTSRCKECKGSKFGETKSKIAHSKRKIEIVDGKVLCLHCNRWLPLTVEYFFKCNSTIGFDLKCKECKGRKFGTHKKNPEYKVIDGVEYKRCTKCNEWKENSTIYFKLMNTKTNAMRPSCKICEYDYHENSEKYKIRSKRYRKNNLSKVKAQIKKHKSTEEFKLKHRIEEQKRRAIKQSLINDLSLKDWKETLNFWSDENNNISCAYCGNIILKPDQEHIIPLSKGGHYTKNNIIPAGGTYECGCNQKKTNNDLNEFFLKSSFFSIQNYLKIKEFMIQNEAIYSFLI